MKSEFFASGVPENSLQQIHLATGFKIGQLPVRYLGVPLVTQKLTSKDCSTLLVKIKSMIDKWSSRHLSFGGRLQLVKSILFNIFGYWSRQLVLPKGVIIDIEKLCMRFFWRGNDIPAKGARVSWSQICCLKSEGGLGLRKLTDWSKACCLLLVRKILADEGSLWIAWIKGYCFKTVDYWNVGCKLHFSWILRKLIKLKDEARRLFWSATNLVQFKAWMVILDRLPTRDRLVRFGVVTDDACGLCAAGQESRNHLFLDCSYAKEVWGTILLHVFRCWNDALRWLVSSLKGKSLLVRILKLAWTGFVYFVWEERNRRIFRGVIRPAEEIVDRVREAIRIKMYRSHVNRLDNVNRRLCLAWDLI
ncbi:uncharacterized protein LOC120138791 [Hibiscus syriacus]|uniref:uncharacterized protein LOC120138791 n=1 Tax=Hibiscus syriacus TaxID=106335 RepID=UPI0019213DCB|nr:uncharacterized protein LOC120138791 [Hibiscus syriacus]